MGRNGKTQEETGIKGEKDSKKWKIMGRNGKKQEETERSLNANIS